MKKKNKMNILFFVAMVLLCLGIAFLVHSLTYGPLPTITTNDSILSFRGGKEETVMATKNVSIKVFDKEVDFLQIAGDIKLNGEPIDGMGERLKVSVYYNSNIYYIGNFTEGYQYINKNNCDLFPMTNDTNFTLKYEFTVPSQYCVCKGDYTFTFEEELRIGIEK